MSTARLLVSCLAATRRDLTIERLDDLKLAVSEACANAINCYGADVEERRILVSWSEDDDHLEVIVSDRGPGYIPDELPSRDSGGLGVRLIQILVDEAHWEPAHPGTSVRMSLKCPRASAELD